MEFYLSLRVTHKRNTPRLGESGLWGDPPVLHAGRATAMPQKAARRLVFAPLFDFVGWHRSCNCRVPQAVRSARTLEEAGSREQGAVNEGRKRIIRTVVAALGLTAFLALQPDTARLVDSAWARCSGGAEGVRRE